MSAFDEIYARLRAIMIAAAPDMPVTVDEPGNLIVSTPDVDARTGEPGRFGSVTVKKTYVAYHLMPMYTDPALGDSVSEALAKRRQGKTCFNFKKVDEPLFTELAALSRRAGGG